MTASHRSVTALLMAVGGLVLLSGISPLAHANAPSGYIITELGHLGGGSAVGYATNNSGQVVGESSTPGGAVHAFRWSTGEGMVDLGTLGGSGSVAYGIDAAGRAVGGAQLPGSLSLSAFRTGVNRPIDPASDFLARLPGSETLARGINSKGQIVGTQGFTTGPFPQAFLYSDGTWSSLGTLGGIESAASGVNDAGQAVGYATTSNGGSHAFLSEAGHMRDLGTLGGQGSWANAINAGGQVVGASWISNDVDVHAFLYSGGTMRDIGTLGGNLSIAFGINTVGQIVGQSLINANVAVHAFLYDGGMKDLNDLIASDSGWLLDAAYAINDRGQIAGSGLHNGQRRAFLLTPPVSPPAPGPSVDLEFGRAICASIHVPLQPNRHRFIANADDTVVLRLTRTSGTFRSRFALYGPDGSSLGDIDYNPTHIEYTSRLPLSGVYTVLVSDAQDGVQTGDYCLYIQRVNRPSNDTPIATGQTVSGKIVSPVQPNTYTFQANANRTVVLRLTRTSGTLRSRFALYGPDGSSLGDVDYNATHIEYQSLLPLTGIYTVLVSDAQDGVQTGDYSFTVIKI